MHGWHWRIYRDITGISRLPLSTIPVLQSSTTPYSVTSVRPTVLQVLSTRAAESWKTPCMECPRKLTPRSQTPKPTREDWRYSQRLQPQIPAEDKHKSEKHKWKLELLKNRIEEIRSESLRRFVVTRTQNRYILFDETGK